MLIIHLKSLVYITTFIRSLTIDESFSVVVEYQGHIEVGNEAFRHVIIRENATYSDNELIDKDDDVIGSNLMLPYIISIYFQYETDILDLAAILDFFGWVFSSFNLLE